MPEWNYTLQPFIEQVKILCNWIKEKWGMHKCWHNIGVPVDFKIHKLNSWECAHWLGASLSACMHGCMYMMHEHPCMHVSICESMLIVILSCLAHLMLIWLQCLCYWNAYCKYNAYDVFYVTHKLENIYFCIYFKRQSGCYVLYFAYSNSFASSEQDWSQRLLKVSTWWHSAPAGVDSDLSWCL